MALGDELGRRRIANCMCFFCIVEAEDSRHRFISCLLTKVISKFINAVCKEISEMSVCRSGFGWTTTSFSNCS